MKILKKMKPSFSIQSITDRSDLTGKRVFLRGALNVPVENREITDDYRLKQLLPTIQWLQEQNARIILAGHMSGNEKNTFQPVFSYLKKHFDLTFITDYADGSAQEAVDAMQNGDVVLLENLRQHDGEKANDPAFAKMLSSYANVYVNDAFPAAHRAHASIVGLPELLPSYAGLQFMREVEELSAVLHPEHPFTFILGGAKFSTKLPLVEKFSGIADHVFVGGALANAYLAADGVSVGDSRVPEESHDLSTGIESVALHLPTDVVCQTATGESMQKSVSDISKEDIIVDLGTDTVDAIIDAVEKSTITVWNGPLGWYEKGFSDGTTRLAAALAKIEGKTILGGGDTAAVILDDLSPDDFSFVSTAGGAMIQFLADETLPGISALEI
jgi:phosphoglycerate kinase